MPSSCIRKRIRKKTRPPETMLAVAVVAHNVDSSAAPRLQPIVIASGAELPKRRRLSRKTPRPPQFPDPMAAAIIAALEAESQGDDDLTALAATVKRQHMHFTHVQTTNPQHVPPSRFTRQGFWKHILKVYKEVYPRAGARTGSIVVFGLVAKERHKKCAKAEHRQQHHHGAVFCTDQHYWNKIAKHSLQKYKVPLNAVAHDGYTIMYKYLRQPTAKKPLQELDAEPFLSEDHPRGSDLEELLLAGTRAAEMHASRRQGRSSDVNPETGAKRERAPRLYDVIRTQDLRTVQELQAHAFAEAEDGNTALAELCTRQGPKLEEVLTSARAIIDAPQRARKQDASLLDKLRTAAVQLPCECAGVWQAGAARVLQRNGISVPDFCSAVRYALQVGAKRGANVACIGRRGCGKSMLFESLEKIFAAASPPEKGSTFALGTLLDCEVILWQDYEHDEATISWADLLRMFVGEGVAARRPGKSNKKEKNRAPCFCTGLKFMHCGRRDPQHAVDMNGAMAERFRIFHFSIPLPMESRVPDYPQCGRCAAAFYLQGSGDTLPTLPLAADDPAAAVPTRPHGGSEAPVAATSNAAPSEPASSSALDPLLHLVRLHRTHVLDDEEFRAAKRRLLGLQV